MRLQVGQIWTQLSSFENLKFFFSTQEKQYDTWHFLQYQWASLNV